METTLEKLPDQLGNVIKAGLVSMITSAPGLGKSDVVKQLAKKYSLKVIDVRLSQLDPLDFNGIPSIASGRTEFVPPKLFPLESDSIPQGYDGWLLLLDEINSAPLSVQAAAYRLVLDKEVGSHRLHPHVAIVAAGNRAIDKAIVNRTSTAMQSRMVHFNLVVDNNTWDSWAVENKIDHRIRSFISFKPELLHNFNPNHSDNTFSCPRTWEFASKLLKVQGEPDLVTLAGTVGEGAAIEFITYCKVFNDLPNIKAIHSNPTGVRIGDAPAILYALSGLVSSHVNKDNIDVLGKFLDRLPTEFQVIALQHAVKADRSLMQTAYIKLWLPKFTKVMKALGI